MRTLHFGLRVADRERSLGFYAALGYEVVGSVPGTSMGDLTMMKLPGDAFVTVEIVSDSSAKAPSRGDGLSHFVIKVESMDGVLAELAAEGIVPDQPPRSPDGSDEFRTAWITDPDGNRGCGADRLDVVAVRGVKSVDARTVVGEEGDVEPASHGLPLGLDPEEGPPISAEASSLTAGLYQERDAQRSEVVS